MNLSARSYVLAALVVLLGIVGEWSGDPLRGLWRIPAAAEVLALGLEWLRVRRQPLALTRRAPAQGPVGRPLRVDYVLHNTTDRSLHLESQARVPTALDGESPVLHWRVEPGAHAIQHVALTPNRLGAIAWLPVHVRVLGHLGLVWWPRRIDLPGELIAVPDRLHGHEAGPAAGLAGDLARRAAGAGHELIGLRDYRPGDPLRAVDWKATARSGRHTVRVFGDEQRLELVLVLDAGRTSGLQAGALTRLHHYANVCARLAERATYHGDSVGLVVFADQPLATVSPVHGARGLTRVRETLAGVKTVARESNPLPAVLRARQLARHRALVVMFTDIDDTDASSQLARAAGLLSPKHLPLVAGMLDPEIAVLARRPAGDWRGPYDSLAAWQAEQGGRRAALRLRRLGASVVRTGPDHLDRAVLEYYETLRERRRV